MLKRRYETDLTDSAWELVKPLLPAARRCRHASHAQSARYETFQTSSEKIRHRPLERFFRVVPFA